MEKKTKGTTALVILLLVVTVGALVLATYAWAKYTTTLPEANATAVVAKWDVNATVNGTATWTKTFTHVVPTKLAPGTSGYIPVELDLGDSEVCANYTITIKKVENKPTNLSFYKGQESTGNVSKTATTLSDNGGTITGTLDLTNHNTASKAKTTEYIVWDWPYEGGNDVADTEEGIAAKTMTVTIEVNFTQVQPQ